MSPEQKTDLFELWDLIAFHCKGSQDYFPTVLVYTAKFSHYHNIVGLPLDKLFEEYFDVERVGKDSPL